MMNFAGPNGAESIGWMMRVGSPPLSDKNGLWAQDLGLAHKAVEVAVGSAWGQSGHRLRLGAIPQPALVRRVTSATAAADEYHSAGVTKGAVSLGLIFATLLCLAVVRRQECNWSFKTPCGFT